MLYERKIEHTHQATTRGRHVDNGKYHVTNLARNDLPVQVASRLSLAALPSRKIGGEGRGQATYTWRLAESGMIRYLFYYLQKVFLLETKSPLEMTIPSSMSNVFLKVYMYIPPSPPPFPTKKREKKISSGGYGLWTSGGGEGGWICPKNTPTSK